ncbi:hypothetical protein ITP53_12305 [Nonomuraea sp. K274]|uniref:FtsX-like permease family protein n=1 Tax=Nonomuraea cypriaca TaxID=1187855 RepID=A0A931A7B7_9ACTN|nr:hypothetical protein [Nonomuraea cypriaca]MBF8186508.1 hypothetical protein [Nonomuraea cypriaca]
MVAAQAAYISGLGALVGLAGGVAAGVALSSAPARTMVRGPGTGAGTISVPWLFLAVVVLGLPVLAALLAGLVTRTRSAPARRMT